MVKGRDNTAENLDEVVEIIRFMRQSGLLSIERFQSGRLEIAEVYFQAGQPVFARAGQMVGQVALAWIMSWHQVRFGFFADQPPPPSNMTATVMPGTINALVARVRPSPEGPFPRPAPSLPSPGGERESSYAMGYQRSSARVQSLEALVPQKLGGDRDVLSLPLTRPQRLIYMLVDGRRNIADLSRCSRKSYPEIERLLIELREQGLVAVQAITPPS